MEQFSRRIDERLGKTRPLVDAAAQVISDPALRIEHESDLKEGRLTPVPASQLGGALALMQEAGEHEAVIEYAPECLADRSAGPALPSGDGGLPGTPADSVLGQILNDLSEPCLNDVVSAALDPALDPRRSSVVALEMNIVSRGS